MTGSEFLNHVTHDKADFLNRFLALLEEAQVNYCVIGGLAVNAYAEPVVSLDLDVVIAGEQLAELLPRLGACFRVVEHANSVNLAAPGSDLRIQIQTDPRYQAFAARAGTREVLGHTMRVAAIEDVLTGKIWAALDPGRRPSKRQKDLADIMRLVEARPDLGALLPERLRSRLAGF
jgi:hypothetical protein